MARLNAKHQDECSHIYEQLIMRIVATLVVLSLVATTVACQLSLALWSQEAPRQTETTKSKNPASEGIVKPAPEMEKLIHALAGEWSADDIYEPSGLLPKGGVGHSRESYRAGPFGLSLIEEYHSEGDAGTSWGIGIIWWDQKAHGFHFLWCDSYALDQACLVSSKASNWHDNEYVETDEHKVSGKRVFEKEVWSDFTPNSFTQALYVGDAPAKVKRFLTIKAKRVAKQP